MPLFSRDTGLRKNSLEECDTNVGLMRIRYMDINLASRHELVSSSRKRAFKSKRSKSRDQLMTSNRQQPSHAARSALRSYFLTDGTNCCFRTFRSNHSSSTSCNSASASFFVLPCAQTPLKEGSEAKYGKESSIFSIFARAMTCATYCVNMTSFYHRSL